MTRALLAMVLGIGALLAVFAAAPPDAKTASAPPAEFSAARARADIGVMAARPHPTSSQANIAVRDYLVRRLTELGLRDVRITPGRSFKVEEADHTAYVRGADTDNITAVLPGREPGKAVALMSHYDSVPGAPGAGDDAAGVATILETVRMLQAAGPPRRDVMVILTDGEEQGLLGARALFADQALRDRIGIVLNIDSRGSRGRAIMFRAGAHADGAVATYRRYARLPTALSLAALVYRVLPNDTDFSVATRHSLQAMDFGFMDGEFDYHSPTDSVEHLDARSVQSLGDQFAPTTLALANGQTLPAPKTASAYNDVFGRFIIGYPVWAGWLLLPATMAAAALAFYRTRRAWDWRGVGLGALCGVLVLPVGGVLIYLGRLATGLGGTPGAQLLLEAHLLLLEIAVFLLSWSGAALALKIFARLRAWSLWGGFLLLGLILAILAQLLAPEAGPLFAWPLALAALGALAASYLGWWGAAPFGVLAVGFTTQVAHLLMVGVGIGMPEVIGLTTLLALLAVAPLAAEALQGRTGWLITLAAALVGFGLAVSQLALAAPSPRYPQATQIIYLADTDRQQAFRVNVLRDESPWTTQALKSQGGLVAGRRFDGFASRPYQSAPARYAPVPVPSLTLRTEGDRQILTLAPASGGRELRLRIKSSVPLNNARVNGVPIPTLKRTGKWTDVAWRSLGQPLVIDFDRTSGAIDTRYTEIVDGWPKDAAPLPARPASVAPWGYSDSTYVTGTAHLALAPP